MNLKSSLLLFTLAGAVVQGAVVGQIDTFETGDTMGWHVGDPGHPTPPTNVAGGQGGADDNYLLIQANRPGGPGSRISALSGPQWAGNYLTAGITAIAMDVNNFGPEDLSLRLLFEDEQPMAPPANLALSKNAVFVPANSGWTRVYFSIAPEDLLPGIFGTVNGALANTDIIRLFHNPAAEFPGPPNGQPVVSAALGIDNIAATVPEPSTYGLAVIGLLAFGWAKTRKSA